MRQSSQSARKQNIHSEGRAQLQRVHEKNDVECGTEIDEGGHELLQHLDVVGSEHAFDTTQLDTVN